MQCIGVLLAEFKPVDAAVTFRCSEVDRGLMAAFAHTILFQSTQDASRQEWTIKGKKGFCFISFSIAIKLLTSTGDPSGKYLGNN